MLVCHLIDATDHHGPPPYPPHARPTRARAWPTTLAMMADAVAAAHLHHMETCVVLIGPTALQTMAAEAGLLPDAVIGVPMGSAVGHWLNIRHKLPVRARQAKLIHAWSLGAAVMAKKYLKPAHLCITIPDPPDATTKRHIAQLAHERHVGWLPINPTYARTLLTLNCRGTQVRTLWPAMDSNRLTTGQSQRAALRQSWGIGTDVNTNLEAGGDSNIDANVNADIDSDAGVDTDSSNVKIVALLSDPPFGPSSADAIAATMAVSLAADGIEMHYPNLRLAVHPMQARRLRAESSMRELGQPDRVIQTPELVRPWQALPACDLALVCGSNVQNVGGNAGGKGHSGGNDPSRGRCGGNFSGEGTGGGVGVGGVIWAMGAGVPIVGEAIPEIQAVVRDEHSALLSPPGEPRFLGHGLRRLIDDPELVRRLTDNARATVQSRHGLARFNAELMTIYRLLIADEPIIDHDPDLS